MDLLEIASRVAAGVPDAMAPVTPAQVKIYLYEVDYGDKRTAGSFAITAGTPLGALQGKGDTGTGDPQREWLFNGQDLGVIDPPDLGVPHIREGHRAMKRFEANRDEEAKQVIAEWLNEAAGDLKEEGLLDTVEAPRGA